MKNIKIAKELLYKVRRVAQNGDVFSSPGFVRDDLRDVIHDFMWFYMKAQNKRIRKRCCARFKRRFDDLETMFVKSFGYFDTNSDLFSAYDKGCSFWWSNVECLPHMVREDNSIPKEMADFIKKISGIKPDFYCDMSDKVAEYAENREHPDILEIRRHLCNCNQCLALFCDLVAE